MSRAHERPLPESRSVGELLRDLANDITSLIRSELALARTEAQEKLHQAIASVVMLLAGSLMAFAALIILLMAVVAVLDNFMPEWLAAILVSVVVVGIGYFLVRKGLNDLSAQRLAPARTTANIKRDVSLVQEKVS